MRGELPRRIGAVAVYLLLVVGLCAGIWRAAFVAALDPLARRAEADLALAADDLTGELTRFKALAVLLADHPLIAPVLSGGAAGEDLLAMLRRTADKTGSLDILIVGPEGEELAAATETPAEDHGRLPDFTRATDGALGLRHGVMDRYGRRAFSFAAPVFSDAGPVVGAVIVVADADAVEAGWRGDRPTVYFSDRSGVIFMSSRSELLLLKSGGTGADGLAPARVNDVSGHEIWQLDRGPYVPARALHQSLDLPAIEMTGEILLDVAPARQLAFLQAAVAGALCLAFGALLFLATERRRTLSLANRRLEARVAERTEELERLNADLRREVAERTDAQARLTRAQAELVQAEKLSALGKMSAGISHELNQPLMAIRSFSDNALGFLDRGRPEVAAENLIRISELARRMGRIIKNLRAFARQESEPLKDVDLCAAIDGALEMVQGRARAHDVEISWTPPAFPVLVRAGEVRLQQVIVNLVSNAVDAMAEAHKPKVEITLADLPGRVQLEVRDFGPGIEDPERIFDPFYSTKSIGAAEGMGLGLSISYGIVQSFGGEIRGRNHPEGGAVFAVELDRAAGAQAA